MKTVFSLVLLTTLLVLGDCHEDGRRGGRKCPSDNLQCKCHRLMKPAKKPDGGKEAMKAVLEACAADLGIELPKIPDGGRVPGRGKPFPKDLMDSFSDELKNCLGMGLMKQLQMVGESGNIVLDAVTTFLTDALNANKDEIENVTTDQINTIIDGIDECVTQASSDALKAFTLHKCMEQTCMDAIKV